MFLVKLEWETSVVPPDSSDWVDKGLAFAGFAKIKGSPRTSLALTASICWTNCYARVTEIGFCLSVESSLDFRFRCCALQRCEYHLLACCFRFDFRSASCLRAGYSMCTSGSDWHRLFRWLTQETIPEAAALTLSP